MYAATTRFALHALLPFTDDRSANGLLIALMSAHRSELVRHLDSYVSAVVHELKVRGVLTCPPQRIGPVGRLTRSVVLDCTALRGAEVPLGTRPSRWPSPGAMASGRTGPVSIMWDETSGWSAEMCHDPTLTRRYPHPGLLPVPTAVADFVAGLFLGVTPTAAALPTGPSPRRLLG